MITESILTIIAALGGTAGIISIIKAIKTPVRTREEQLTIIQEAIENSSLKEDIKKIQEKLNKNDEATVCLLRNSITSIYEQYRGEETLPSLHMKENLCKLYSKYIELGGNSYVKQIYSEMMEWKIK